MVVKKEGRRKQTSDEIPEEPSPIVLEDPVEKRKQPVDVAADISHRRAVMLDEFLDRRLGLEIGISVGIVGDLLIRQVLVEAQKVADLFLCVLEHHDGRGVLLPRAPARAEDQGDRVGKRRGGRKIGDHL